MNFLSTLRHTYISNSDLSIRENYDEATVQKLFAVRLCWEKYFRHLYMNRLIVLLWSKHKKWFFFIFAIMYGPGFIFTILHREHEIPRYAIMIMAWFSVFFVFTGIWSAIDHYFQLFRRKRVMRECGKLGVPINTIAELNSYCDALGISWEKPLIHG